MSQRRLSDADWTALLAPLEALLRAAGIPMPLQMARNLLATLRRRTSDGKLAAAYQREDELDLLEEAIEPLAGVALEQVDTLAEIQRSQDQVLELLFRVLSTQPPHVARPQPTPETPLVEYRIASGWAGMYHLLHGAERVFVPAGSPAPRLIDTPAMALVRMLQPLVGHAAGEPRSRHLDLRKLVDAGAPVESCEIRSEWMHAPAPGVDPSWWLRRTDGWISIGPGCDDSHAEYAVALEGMARKEVQRRGRELETWMIAHFETKHSEWGTQVRAPIIEVLPVHVYCLYLHAPAGTLLTLTDSVGRSQLVVEFDERPLLIPLGLTFGHRPLSPRGKWLGPSPDISDPDDPLFEMSATLHPDSLCERLEEIYARMRGPRLDVVGLSWRRGEAHGQIDLRGPRRVWDCVDIHFFGASCPEVFVRIDQQPWEYIGSVLVGADTPTRARSERHRLGPLAIGQEARVILRELPGELATIEVRLIAIAGDSRWKIDAVPITHLGAEDILTLYAPTQDCDIELELEVMGFFDRFDILREVHS